MKKEEFASMALTATITAVLTAPAAYLLSTWLGADGTTRTAIVAAVTAAVTTAVAARQERKQRA